MAEESVPNAPSEAQLIEGWIELQYRFAKREAADDLIWAHAVLDEICNQAPAECLRLILRILERDPSDFIAGNLAAGPLEDLLCRHGPEVIDSVESEATSVPRFRDLLGGVWRNVIREDIWDRLQALRAPGSGHLQ